MAGPQRIVDGRALSLVLGDITQIAADAMGNAANAGLVGGGGVDGAIHRAGGPSIMAELRARYPHGTPTGTAVATSAGALPARWVIHAVGPIWRGGGAGEADLLRSAYRSAVELASSLGARSLTLPAISCGIYGYPLELAAPIAIEAVADPLLDTASLESVTFVLFSQPTFDGFEEALARDA